MQRSGIDTISTKPDPGYQWESDKPTVKKQTQTRPVRKRIDVASDVGVNLCDVRSSLHTSNNGVFTDKGGDIPCFNISKNTCAVVKSLDEKFVLFYIYVKSKG